MNKLRLEALSDGVFAIVFTLLAIEIKIPEHLEVINNANLLHSLNELSILIFAYFVTFVVIGMYWLNHSFLFGVFVKNINRQMVNLNLLFLSFIALLPFSSHLLGAYLNLSYSTLIYGIHILIISLISNFIFYYAIKSEEIDTSHVSKRLLNQSRIRQALVFVFTFLGILIGFLSTRVAVIFFMFPIIFNIIPGTLDFVERTFKISLD